MKMIEFDAYIIQHRTTHERRVACLWSIEADGTHLWCSMSSDYPDINNYGDVDETVNWTPVAHINLEQLTLETE